MELIFNMVFGLMAVAGIGCLLCNAYYYKYGVSDDVSDETPSQESDDNRPQNLLENVNEEDKDDLKLIKGVGPKLESTLNTLGVYHFEQIAAWSEVELAWIDDYLSFHGRAKRDDWIAQAKTLANN